MIVVCQGQLWSDVGGRTEPHKTHNKEKKNSVINKKLNKKGANNV